MASDKTSPIAGSDIDSFCGKCKLELAHIVVATRPGQAARVQCKTCGAQHAMRKTKPAATKASKAASKAASAKTKSQKKVVALFEEACVGKDLSQAKSYALASTFSQGDVLRHPTFGTGVVLKMSPERKMEVIFDNAGMKVLAHSRS